MEKDLHETRASGKHEDLYQNLGEVEKARKFQKAPLRINPGAKNAARQRYAWAALPYGIYRTADGGAVVFNRRYQPLFRCRPHEQPEQVDPSLYVYDIIKPNRYFYDDGCSPSFDDYRYRRLIKMLARLRGMS